MTDTTKQTGRREGERQKLMAFGAIEAHREHFVLAARRALLTALLANGTATADEVRDVVELPDRLDPKLFGAVPTPLARAGIIRAVGFTKTCRPKAHARPLTVWQLADRVKAEAWLAAHPLAEKGD